ncbi:MAG: response regulator [Leptospirales bacterium]|nr:response regulator [Leptospirales bacterium]
MNRKTKVMIVDDSATARALLELIFSSDPDFEVAGAAASGAEALAAIERIQPDLVTMDLHMPEMDGRETTRRLMQERPTPILMVSATTTAKDARHGLGALEAGALAFLQRPQGPGDPTFQSSAGEIRRLARLLSEVPVVRRRPALAAGATTPHRSSHRIRVLGIGGSTGAPMPLRTILGAIPAEAAYSIVVVQHISAGFQQGLIDWLASATRLEVREAKDKERLDVGVVYFPPENWHIGFHADQSIELSQAAPEHHARPSVSYLFRGLATTFGAASGGVLLSGMGEDGAAELLDIRRAGGLSIAQSEESCILHGMPGAAQHMDAAEFLLSPTDTGELLASLAAQGGSR